MSAREDNHPLEGEATTTTTTTTHEDNNNVESSSSSSTEPAQASEEEINHKIQKGKLLFAEDKYWEAAELFGDVLHYKVTKYGELALECAESYYLYGWSLFCYAKSESTVLGPETQKKIDEKDEDDSSDEEQEEEEAPAQANGEEGEGKSIEKQEDPEGIQVAWETLEVARLIYQKHPEKASELSDVQYVLAEIFLETDNCDASIEEFKKCVSLRESIFPPTDRRIAAAYPVTREA